MDIIVGHVVDTLPGDIHRRRAVLNALVDLMPGKCPAPISAMLGDLDRHMARQEEFAFSGTPRGSGRLGDTSAARSARKGGQ